MPLSIAYWILMLLMLLSGGYLGYTTAPPGRVPILGWSLLLFLLLLVLGLKVFGGPVQG